jgi:hypothetical protein
METIHTVCRGALRCCLETVTLPSLVFKTVLPHVSCNKRRNGNAKNKIMFSIVSVIMMITSGKAKDRRSEAVSKILTQNDGHSSEPSGLL